MIVRADDIPEKEINFSAIRASGPGGQHVNKTSSAVHLKFDIFSSSLPKKVKDGLLGLQDSRITSAGLLVIKAGAFRSQEKNRVDALHRLDQLLATAQKEKKARKKTRPSLGSKKRRLSAKKKRANLKKLRNKIED
tara:strand:+ start:1648 stop:2055 length:408 start_codon:yes stop_codon:yes gene_type:complete